MQTNQTFDVIVVGSGPAGAHAAYPLVEAGLNVAMIDGGVEPKTRSKEIFDDDFEGIRNTDKNQYKLFLGESLSGIAPEKGKEVHVISMTGGGREYVSDNTDLLPINEEGVQVVQSLAKGGLSEIWAALCDVFDKEELEAVGLPVNEMKKNYQEVMDRIGMSGVSETYSLQEPLEINNHAKSIFKKYAELNDQKKDGFVALHPMHAVITEPFKGRKPFAYKDLEYAANVGNSIYRPRFTIEELEKSNNFSYFPQKIVEKISKEGDIRKVEVKTFDGREESFTSTFVVLAAGSLNSTRILLKSFSLIDTKVPFITKTHFIIPSINLKTLGKKDDRRQSSLCQLIIKDNNEKTSFSNKIFAQFHTYKSFLLHRLVKYIPLPATEAMSFLSMVAPSFIILDVRFPSLEDKNLTSAHLKEDGSIYIEGNEVTTKGQKKRLRSFKRLLLRLGLLPLRTIRHPFGSTAHYAGGIPIGKEGDFPLTSDSLGRLNEDKKIYIADSATWKMLPAKAPTLTIMANANRIGRELLKEWKKTSSV
jgi:hypothetical protein